MKKTIISVLISMMMLSLAGCSSKPNEEFEAMKSQLNETTLQINTLQETVDELSNKIEELKNFNIKHVEKDNTVITIGGGYYLPNLDDYAKEIDSIKKKFEAEGKKVIAPEKPFGNRIIVITTSETITDFKYGDFDERLQDECEIDTDKYMRKFGGESGSILAKELKPNEVLIFAGYETEGIPSNYYQWTEPDGTRLYSIITYNGKGES